MKQILDEVKTLARLFHKNVIRYYHSWLEIEAEEATPVKSIDPDKGGACFY